VNISFAGVLMTDILNRLQTVVEHARIGVDPVWLKIAITEIQQQRAENMKLACTLMSPLVFVHENITAEVDEILKPYIGGNL
jgi:hypothetical protein